jgi:hypothetical protein
MAEDDTAGDVEKLFETARRNTGPRKHHLVPASYLARWATPTSRVRVLDIDSGQTYLATPSNAARQTDFYLATSEDLDPEEVPPMLFETMLSRVEGPATGAIDELVEMPATITAQTRYDLATFMAFQFVRGDRTRAALAAQAHEVAKLHSLTMTEARVKQAIQRRGEEPTAEAIRLGLEALQALRDDEIILRPQDAQLVWIGFAIAQQLADTLYHRAWIVASTHASLVTTDEPVLPVAGPGWWNRAQSCGVVPAGVVVFPLAPDRVLLAVRRDIALSRGLPLAPNRIAVDELGLVETFEICQELLMSANRWAFERAERRLLDHIPVPAKPEPISTETYQEVDGTSELVRQFSYTRMRNSPFKPDWPLWRLWPEGWRCWPMPPDLIEEAEAAVPEWLEQAADDSQRKRTRRPTPRSGDPRGRLSIPDV